MALIFVLNWISSLIILYLEKRYCGNDLQDRYYRCRKTIFKYLFKKYSLIEKIVILIFISLLGIFLSLVALLDFINSIKIDNKKIRVTYGKNKATFIYTAKDGIRTEEEYTYNFLQQQ